MKQLLCSLAAWALLAGLPGPAKAQYGYTTIDPPGAAGTLASGINNVGQIVGGFANAGGTQHGFLRDVDGTYTTLDVPGSSETFAYGVNDAGQIVGEYRDSTDNSHGFFLDADGSYTTLDVPGAALTFAYGINASGQIVGVYEDASGQHGFLATPN